jgi:hypothetical protein
LNAYSQLITHEISDGGLATSTHRLAINTGNDLSHPSNPLFNPSSKPLHLPTLDAFLSRLPQSAGFTPWTDILTPQEIQQYQRNNYRKFPPWEEVPRGCSITDVKRNSGRRDRFPGLENDWWRFLVDVCVLGAGSPYARDISVQVFALYTHAVTLMFVRKEGEQAVERVEWVTGREAMGLVVVFLLCPLLVYKALGKSKGGRPAPGVHDVFPTTTTISDIRPSRIPLGWDTVGKRDWEVY